MRFLMLVRVDGSVRLSAEEAAAMGPATDGWVEEMVRRGIRLEGNELAGSGDATTVRRRGDEVLVTDGPFAETKEQIAGYDVVECSSLDEAIEAAARHPVAAIGALEVRAIAGEPAGWRSAGRGRYLFLHAFEPDELREARSSSEVDTSLSGWLERVIAGGQNLHGGILSGTGAVVRRRGDEVLVTDGPFAETKEQVAGYDVMDCADLDEAIELAAAHPSTYAGGSIEIRPFAVAEP